MRITAVIAAAVMALCLTACAADKDSSAESSKKADSSAAAAEASGADISEETDEVSEESSEVSEESSKAAEESSEAAEESSKADDSSEAEKESSEVSESSQADEESEAEEQPQENSVPDENAEQPNVIDDDISLVTGTGYSVNIDLTRWVDVTDQAAPLANNSQGTVLEHVYGWLPDGKSSCAFAISDLGTETTEIDLHQVKAMIDSQSTPEGQIFIGSEVCSQGGYNWVRAEYDLDASVYGESARSVQYNGFYGTYQMTVSFSIAENSIGNMDDDINAIIDSIQLG